jgi:hypothetical protein
VVWCLSRGATFLYLAVINENNMRLYSGNHYEDSSIVARNMKLSVAGVGVGDGGVVVINLSSDIVQDTLCCRKLHVLKLS